MPWRDRHRRGSFRGEPFVLVDGQRPGGRRLAENHAIRADLPKVEDLGRRGPRWRLRFFVIGPDHDIAAVAMLRALEDARPGYLLHPLYGRHLAHVDNFVLSENGDQLGVTFFEAEFVVVDEMLPKAEAATAADASAAAAATQAAAGAAVEEGVAVGGVPEFVRAATAGAVEIVGTAIAALRFVDAQQAEVARVASLAAGLVTSAARLALAPANLVGSVRAAVRQVGAAVTGARQSFYAYRQLFELDAGVTGGRTANGLAADRNRRLVVDLARAEALAAAALAATRAEWESGREAGRARDELLALVDDLEARADDDLVQGLQDLRSVLHRSAFTAELPDDERTHVVLERTLPAIAVAYRFLDNAEREDEVVAINSVTHPLFVPGGVELEIPLAE